MTRSFKRYACPTKEEALASLVARKKAQISILKAQLRSAEHDLRMAETGVSSTTLQDCVFELAALT